MCYTLTYPNASGSDRGNHSDLGALDFSIDDASPVENEIDSFLGGFTAVASSDELDTSDEIESFTVTNPPGTVTVTTLIDGRVHQIELSPRATTMTETLLAEEIVVIAGLATQSARSAQYTALLAGMREHGHDGVGTRDFLSRDLQLPTPEQALAARAAVFAARYTGDG